MLITLSHHILALCLQCVEILGHVLGDEASLALAGQSGRSLPDFTWTFPKAMVCLKSMLANSLGVCVVIAYVHYCKIPLPLFTWHGRPMLLGQHSVC